MLRYSVGVRKFQNPYLHPWKKIKVPPTTDHSMLLSVEDQIYFTIHANAVAIWQPQSCIPPCLWSHQILGRHEEPFSGKGCFIYSLTLKECFVFLSVLWSAVNTYTEVYCKYTIITTACIRLIQFLCKFMLICMQIKSAPLGPGKLSEWHMGSEKVVYYWSAVFL